MNEHEKNKFKSWWKNQPDKTLFLIAFAIYGIYRLGYIIGVFLANIGF